jgi:hypothetical protein
MYSAWMLAQRRARFRWILTRIDHPRGRPLRILDVGGTVRYWATMPWQELQPVRITLLNLMLQPVIAPFSSVVGDARALPFPNRSFDVVISNSSLGHVGPYGDQARMAREVEPSGRVISCRRLTNGSRSIGERWSRHITGCPKRGRRGASRICGLGYTRWLQTARPRTSGRAASAMSRVPNCANFSPPRD